MVCNRSDEAAIGAARIDLRYDRGASLSGGHPNSVRYSLTCTGKFPDSSTGADCSTGSSLRWRRDRPSKSGRCRWPRSIEASSCLPLARSSPQGSVPARSSNSSPRTRGNSSNNRNQPRRTNFRTKGTRNRRETQRSDCEALATSSVPFKAGYCQTGDGPDAFARAAGTHRPRSRKPKLKGKFAGARRRSGRRNQPEIQITAAGHHAILPGKRASASRR